ncbi:MAG: hypothetical protein KatS3mg088_110 [Patescibacteria group bacterium]|nr:MAG: hypothetical protein KatS3mg088_110 [Patescibacteria group bacterium]
MNLLNASSFKVLGNLDKDGWSSVYESDSGLVNDPKGRLWIVVSSDLSKDSVSGISFGREILIEIHNEYYSSNSTSNFYSLKGAVEKAFLSFRNRFPDLEIGAASWADGVLNTAVVGGAQAGIFRKQFLVKILVSNSDDVICASGYPQDGDLFVLGTSDFFNCFGNSDFELFLDREKKNGDGQMVLREKMTSFDKTSKISGSLIYFAQEDIKTIQPVFSSSGVSKVKELKREKFLFLLKRILEAISRNQKPYHRRIYIRPSFQELDSLRSRKRGFILATILIFLLLLSALIGARLKRARERESNFQSRFLEAFSKLDDARKLVSVDPEKSRQLFLEAKDEASSLKKDGFKDKKLDELTNNIKNLEEVVLKEYHLEPELFLDLTLLAQGFDTQKLKADVDNILALDGKNKRLIKIAFENKKTQVIAGPDDFENYQDVALYSDDFFVLTSKGFFNVLDNKKELFRNDFGDDAWVNFYAGNVYVLDKNASRIYRLSPTKDGFSLPQIWIGEGIEVDFNSAKDWFIDGSIWVLLDGNQILRFTRGVPTKISLNGVYPSISQIDSIYSNEELKFVYLLDTKNSRVVIVDKNGNYIAQYFSDRLKDAKFLVASEKEKKIVLSLNGGKLMFIEIKHL